MLKKTLASPLDCKEIQPVQPICWSSYTLATWCKELTHLKRPWCWERLKVGGEGDDEGWDGWMASLTQRTWVLLNWVGDGQGGLACCSPWSCKESDTTEQLNWTELAVQKILSLVRSHLFIFIFVTLKDVLKKMLLQLMSKCVVPLFFS